MKKKLKITLLRSPVSRQPRQRRTLRALGLTRVGQTVEQEDTPVLRGMLDVIAFMVKVEDSVEGGAPDASA
ncbi:MAG: 50S ribosomal protein L30 [Firmicutes bacterium]|nr:50S ribosomal protein L30 [Bacillota bacterium]